MRTVGRAALRIAVTVLLGGLLGATLVRFAPGYGIDERTYDARYSSQTIAEIQAEQSARRESLPQFYWNYLSGLARGDLGYSQSLNRPATELFRERLPVTLRGISIALALALPAALLLALLVAATRSSFLTVLSGMSNGALLCIPAGVMALIFLFYAAPPALALALLIFPKIFEYSRNLLVQSYSAPHVFAARARGIGGGRLFLSHVVPHAAPQLIAVIGIAFSLGLGAAIPVEALCDVPGIGQLAWTAAQGRDLVLLVNITLLATFVITTANVLAESSADRMGRTRA